MLTSYAPAATITNEKHSLSLAPASSSKRVKECSSPILASPSSRDANISIPFLLRLKEEDVWALRKSDLRKYFLALQSHALSSQPLPDISASPTSHPSPLPVSQPEILPALLRLPLELREIIYKYLLSPPASEPIRGPHPRQLQTQLSLSQSFAPAILRASRQIFHEALAVFYGCSTQTIYIKIDYNVWTHKMQRSELLMSPQVSAAMRYFHINVYLGNEKKRRLPEREDSEARLAVVRKGVRKLGKWLSGTDIKTLKISWNEPPATYTWDQKKEVLDEFRTMRPEKVDVGEINWSLKYPGKVYRFEKKYLKELERDFTKKEGDVTEAES